MQIYYILSVVQCQSASSIKIGAVFTFPIPFLCESACGGNSRTSFRLYVHGSRRVQDGEHHHADVREHGKPHARISDGPEKKNQRLDSKCEPHVLSDDGHRSDGDPDRFRDLQQGIVHDDNIGSFYGRIAAQGSHGDPYIRAHEDRRIIDPISRIGKRKRPLRQKRLERFDLVGWNKDCQEN